MVVATEIEADYFNYRIVTVYIISLHSSKAAKKRCILSFTREKCLLSR